MIVGQPPFCDEEPMGIYQKILSGKIVFPKFFDKNGKVLVKKLLTADLGKKDLVLFPNLFDKNGHFSCVFQFLPYCLPFSHSSPRQAVW